MTNKSKNFYVRLNEEEVEYIRQNCSKLFPSEIAEWIGCSISTVNQYRRKFKLPPRSIKWKDKEDKLCELWNRGYTVTMIAEYFGCSEGAINSRMNVLRNAGRDLIKRKNMNACRMQNKAYKANKLKIKI